MTVALMIDLPMLNWFPTEQQLSCVVSFQIVMATSSWQGMADFTWVSRCMRAEASHSRSYRKMSLHVHKFWSHWESHHSMTTWCHQSVRFGVQSPEVAVQSAGMGGRGCAA